jgi:WD40 repeat protein
LARHNDRILGGLLLEEHNQLWTCSNNSEIKVWSVADNNLKEDTLLVTLKDEGTESPVFFISYWKKKELILASGWDCVLHAWNVKTLKLEWKLDTCHCNSIPSVITMDEFVWLASVWLENSEDHWIYSKNTQ